MSRSTLLFLAIATGIGRCAAQPAAACSMAEEWKLYGELDSSCTQMLTAASDGAKFLITPILDRKNLVDSVGVSSCPPAVLISR